MVSINCIKKSKLFSTLSKLILILFVNYLKFNSYIDLRENSVNFDEKFVAT